LRGTPRPFSWKRPHPSDAAYFFLSASNTFLAGRIVSNPAFNNQARTRAAEVKCRHAETLRASSDRRFGLTQIKAASLRRMVARSKHLLICGCRLSKIAHLGHSAQTLHSKMGR
jgi:hypothetical protein